MGRKRSETVRQQVDLVVLVVGGPDPLVHAAYRLAPEATGARVETAAIDEAATFAAEHRPFAIVLSEDLYELDPPEFTALGRDVGATVIPLATDGLSPARIGDAMGPKLLKALEARFTL